MRKRNTWAARRQYNQERGRRGGKRSQQVQSANRANREPDSDTIRKRALHDARGQIERHGHTYTATHGVIEWCICRSVLGRSDQVDLVVNGRIRETGKRRDVRNWLGKPLY